MRRSILLWLILSLATATLNISNNASAQSNGRYDRRDHAINSGYAWRGLEGRWYLGGHRDMPAEIFSTRQGLAATNEFGHTTRLAISRSGDVRALDWEGGLLGNVRRDRIVWENGTTWTRQPLARYAWPR
jgi:hypothetical protein